MVKWAEKRKVQEPEEQEDGDDLSDGSDGKAGDGGEGLRESESEDDAKQQEDATRDAMLYDPRPVAGGDLEGGVGAEVQRSAGQLLSAAGPAPEAPAVRPVTSTDRGPMIGLENPEGYNWEAAAFRPWTEGARLEKMFNDMRGLDVETKDEEGPTPCLLYTSPSPRDS